MEKCQRTASLGHLPLECHAERWRSGVSGEWVALVVRLEAVVAESNRSWEQTFRTGLSEVH